MHSGRIVSMFCAAALVAAFAVNAQTNVYRWVDKDGKVHFSDAPPPPDVKEVTQKRMGAGPSEEPQLPFATREAMRRNPVVLYSSNECGALCSDARSLLARRGVPYTERNTSTSRADAQQLQKLIGALQVPLLTIGEKTVKGYDEELWHAALDAAGYARAPLPGQNAPASALPRDVAPAPKEPPAEAQQAAPPSGQSR